jgi:hypothetical protein
MPTKPATAQHSCRLSHDHQPWRGHRGRRGCLARRQSDALTTADRTVVGANIEPSNWRYQRVAVSRSTALSTAWLARVTSAITSSDGEGSTAFSESSGGSSRQIRSSVGRQPEICAQDACGRRALDDVYPTVVRWLTPVSCCRSRSMSATAVPRLRRGARRATTAVERVVGDEAEELGQLGSRPDRDGRPLAVLVPLTDPGYRSRIFQFSTWAQNRA